MPGELKPRILRFEIGKEEKGETIKSFLMRRVGFSSKQLSRFKYRKDGILLNGEKRYVNAGLSEGDVLEIRLTQGGEPTLSPGGSLGRMIRCPAIREPGTGVCRRSGLLQPAGWRRIILCGSSMRIRISWLPTNRPELSAIPVPAIMMIRSPTRSRSTWEELDRNWMSV